MSETLFDDPAGSGNWSQKLEQMLGISAKPKRPVINPKNVRAIYESPETFAQFLRVRYQDKESMVFVMDDERSCGVALDVGHVAAQDRSLEDVMEKHESMLSAFDNLPERDVNPYVIDIFSHDVPLIQLLYQSIDYADAVSGKPDDALAVNYKELLHEHFQDLTSDEGLFSEGKFPWRGIKRKSYLLIYRTFDKHETNLKSNIEELHDIAERVENGLNASSINNYRMSENQYYQWLYPWFNKGVDGNSASDYSFQHPYIDGEAMDGVPDFETDLLDWIMGTDQPDSGEPTPEDGTWKWGDHYVRYIPIVGMQSRPRVGAITVKHSKVDLNDDVSKPLFNRMPDNTIFTMKIIITPQDVQQLEIEQQAASSRAVTNSAKVAMSVIKPTLAAMALGYKQYPAYLGFFIRDQSKELVLRSARKAISEISASRFRCIDISDDVVALDEAAKALPFAYKPEYDKELMRQYPLWLHDLTSIMPFWGQSEVSGNPCLLLFDRVGNPISFDPLSKDRVRVAHMFLGGPTGSGKSSLLNALLLSMIAVHRPILHLIDYGGSYTYLADYLKSCGLSVNYNKCSPRETMALPIFGKAQAIVDEVEGLADAEFEDSDDFDADAVFEDEAEFEELDLLNKATFTCKIMVAGGKKAAFDNISTADSSILKEAVTIAAYERLKSDDHHQIITSDLVKAVRGIASGVRLDGEKTQMTELRREHIMEMADAINYFTMGFYGRMFDRPSKPISDADVNITDIGILGNSSDYNDAFTLVWVGLLNHLQALSEHNRSIGQERDIILCNDEAHITMEAELLPALLGRGSKTFRKQRIWMILATQELEDVPPQAKKIVAMTEFQFYLTMKKTELAKLENFVDLTDEHKSMILSCRKEDNKYAEGVLISERYPPQIFRNIPFALAMALGQTESKEREARNKVKGLLLEESKPAGTTDITKEIAKKVRADRRAA